MPEPDLKRPARILRTILPYLRRPLTWVIAAGVLLGLVILGLGSRLLASTSPSPTSLPTRPTRTPFPTQTYQVDMRGPFVIPRASVTPQPAWQLVPQTVTSEIPAIKADLFLTYPAIQPADSPSSAAFNLSVMDILSENQVKFRDWMGTPLPEWLRAGMWVSYHVPSARGFVTPPLAKNPLEQIAALTDQEAVLASNPNWLSVLMVVSTYTGGAHPGTVRIPLNFDLSAARPLELAELFRPGSDYLQVIADYCQAELAQRDDLLGSIWLNGADPTPENYATWGLMQDGLLIVFQEYQVGPYAAGAQYVVIPWESLSGILK